MAKGGFCSTQYKKDTSHNEKKMHKKNLHPNAVVFQLKKREERMRPMAAEFVGFFFGFSHGFGDF
jgi:hypothetical protein